MLNVLPIAKQKQTKQKSKVYSPSAAGVAGPKSEFNSSASMVEQLLKTEALRGKDIIGIKDLSASDILLIISTAKLLKLGVSKAAQLEIATGKSLVMLFEKPSLRTRVTFEVGMTQLGGHAVNMEGLLGKREPVADVARNLERWVDVIMARTFSHDTIIALCENAEIPVINGLSDLEHPCQALADFQTISEHKGKLAGLKLAFIGDGNNVANSLMLLSGKVGTDFAIACPRGYEPDPAILSAAKSEAETTGAKIEVVNDPVAAVKNADIVYTDVWVSMGQESDYAEKIKAFDGFKVDSELMKQAGEACIFMHCLPAHRGEEVDCAVIDGPQSVVYDQAENRLHAQKAILSLVL